MSVKEYPVMKCPKCGAVKVPIVENMKLFGLHEDESSGAACELSFAKLNTVVHYNR